MFRPPFGPALKIRRIERLTLRKEKMKKQSKKQMRHWMIAVILILPAGLVAQIRFSAENPWLSESGEVLNPPLQRIDVSKNEAGKIPNLKETDWTVAVWNFPAWNPGGKHWPELASRKPLRIPLLYDSTDPEVRYNGITYYRLADPRVMDWQIKWMREAGINLVMFDWYPSESKEQFDNSPKHRHINDSIEVGFLRKPYTGAPPVKTNPYAKKIKFVAMWTNHGDAWVPEGTMEYACENFLNQPNYYCVDGKPLIIVHAPGLLRDEVGGMDNLYDWVAEQRRIARSYGHEIFLTLGDILPQYSAAFRAAGFDGAFNYVTQASDELVSKTDVVYALGDKTAEGTLYEADYEEVMIPSQKKHWNAMYSVWGSDGFFPTVTVREDWRHWHPQRMLYYHGCTPALYGEALRLAKETVLANDGRRFVTVGIWNEFYEDGYLEPDLKYGFEYLKQIRAVFDNE